MRRRVSFALITILGIASAWLFLRPIPVRPEAYRPPPSPPLTGPLAVNRELAGVELLLEGELPGPEDVELDASGQIYCGLEDGRIVRLGGEGIEDFVQTGGRPLGLDFDRDGTLWVADTRTGLVSVDRDGRSRVRVTAAGGVPLRFADDVDTRADGRVYFSDASSTLDYFHVDLAPFESPPTGRLIELDPATGSVRVLLDGLSFANGVAVSPGGDFVLVAETFRYRIRRYWLSGPRAGESEVFADNLPGFPDGVSSDGRGGFWVALFTVRHEMLDRWVHPRAWLKELAARLPSFARMKARRYGLVVALDAGGRIVHSLHDPVGERFANVTSVEQWGDDLYLGSIEMAAIGHYKLGKGDL